MASAEPLSSEWIAAEDIRAELIGRPLAGTYTTGRAWTEHMKPDGTTVLAEEGIQSRGTWRFTQDGMLCFAYDGAQPLGGCFRYRRHSRNCYDHFFPADPVRDPEIAPGSWVANGFLWRSDEPATCSGQPTS